MMLRVAEVLTKQQVADCRRMIDATTWVDGAATAGQQAIHVKRNMQLPEGSREAVEMGNMILDALAKAPLFLSAALPLKIYPPRFNRYQGGEHYGTHVDNAIFNVSPKIGDHVACTALAAARAVGFAVGDDPEFCAPYAAEDRSLPF